MKYLLHILILALAIGNSNLQAQELQCNVTVSHKQIQGTNTQIFTTLQKSISSLMNGQKWTNLPYGSKERIQCNLFINITSRDGDNFAAEIQIQSSRPIYNSTYNSTLLNHKDKEVNFSYKEFTPLIYNENQIESNLVAVVAFYAYYMIALDQDTYVLNGGDNAYRKADQIVSQAQNTSYVGWKAFDNNSQRNRYWMVKQALQPDFQPYRKFLYVYHIQGLDVMANTTSMGQKVIESALPLLEEVNKNKSSSQVMQMLFDAKSSELVSIFSQGSITERKNAATILKRLDPTRVAEYDKITKD